MLSRELSVVILAAGKSTRMVSSIPKVLHLLAGKPVVQYVIDTAIGLNPARIHFVYGHNNNLFRKYLSAQTFSLNWVLQFEQHGTGDAIKQVIPNLRKNEDVLILYGDVPLVSISTLKRLLIARPEGGIGLLTAIFEKPNGYGRVIRENEEVICVVEQTDANEQQKKIKEINTGILVVNSNDLNRWVNQLTSHNVQGELYLTDIIKKASNEGRKIKTVQPTYLSEVMGVNNKIELALLERCYQREQAEFLLSSGVMLTDPNRFDLRGELWFGQDVSIDINVIIEGRVVLGNRVVIGAGCILKNTTIGDDVIVNPYVIIENSYLESRSIVGPFARLRPGSKIDKEAHVGNFVEIKETYLGKGSKVGHLSYLGDANIGASVNIGAGTITCNYDGANKHKTIIGNNVLIGSNTQLVAPVTIEDNATVGAGTTVTKDIANGEMVISRIGQFSVPKWQRPVKKTKI